MYPFYDGPVYRFHSDMVVLAIYLYLTTKETRHILCVNVW